MATEEPLNRLRVVMAERNVTNGYIAKELGVSEITVSRWRNNRIQPSMAQFLQLAQLLKVDIKDLLECESNFQEK